MSTLTLLALPNPWRPVNLLGTPVQVPVLTASGPLMIPIAMPAGSAKGDDYAGRKPHVIERAGSTWTPMPPWSEPGL